MGWDSPQYLKNWLAPPCPPTVLTQKCRFCHFHAAFGHFAQTVPHQLTPFGKPCSRDLMFCSNFSFTIFSLMFFPLLPKVFADILKIYELPKIYNNVPKYCQTIV